MTVFRDAERLWPDFFVEEGNDPKDMSNEQRMARDVLRKMEPVGDDRFKRFFENTTQSKLLVY